MNFNILSIYMKGHVSDSGPSDHKLANLGLSEACPVPKYKMPYFSHSGRP